MGYFLRWRNNFQVRKLNEKLSLTGDSEHINETVETIDMLIVSAIEQLKIKKVTA